MTFRLLHKWKLFSLLVLICFIGEQSTFCLDNFTESLLNIESYEKEFIPGKNTCEPKLQVLEKKHIQPPASKKRSPVFISYTPEIKSAHSEYFSFRLLNRHNGIGRPLLP